MIWALCNNYVCIWLLFYVTLAINSILMYAYKMLKVLYVT